MVKFKELGFNNFNEYTKQFFNLLLPTNKTYEYFVDWNKVKSIVNEYLGELSLLNSLTKVAESKRGEYLHSLLTKYPQIVEVIPLLIAERAKNGKIDIFDPVKDIHDYLLGVEVGIDTNARKNRNGNIFERMCQEKMKQLVSENYNVVDNDLNFSLYPIITKGRSKGKTNDVVIYKRKKS